MDQICLANSKPLKSGGEKMIFRHPHAENQVIKVINPKYIGHMHKHWPISTRLRRLKYYWFFLHELVEHLISRERQLANVHFLQNIIGLVDTDLGFGLVSEAVTQSDGRLAPTLGDLLREKRFGASEQQALNAFCAWLSDTPLIVRDLTVENLVWNEKQQHFVVIDGIGGRRLPTLRSVSQTYNRYGNRKRIRKLRARVAAKMGQSQTASH